MATINISLPAPAPDETTPYSLFGMAKAKAGQGDALAARLLALVEPTRSEPGALQYHVHRDRDDPDLFAFYEVWETVEHLRARHRVLCPLRGKQSLPGITGNGFHAYRAVEDFGEGFGDLIRGNASRPLQFDDAAPHPCLLQERGR